jgi:putative peptide zinc metalloprotease protein
MTEAAMPRPLQARAAQLEIPQRPQLAPGIQLQGEMTETAYKVPPWLLERDGAYIPVPRLLYAVAEQANGKQTLPQMAAAVSDALQRHVTAEDIGQLVANLIWSGIIATPDGSAVDMPAASAAAMSPLTVNMRMAMFNPRLIDIVSNVLKVLFWWPVVLLVLAAGAAVEGWVYLVHGIGGGLRDAIYAPGFVLLVLAAIVLAAGFHEFGHAAALRYGGGRAKGMGAGFYLFYPAFYTDVTDNYRLPRWSRLRTDLGGFYFHLIFALATMGIYVATGWEPLLVIVVLINLEIIHQLMPFVRLDGYWTLADITGIPDFFSHFGPFLRSLLPLPFLKGTKMPELKAWAKVVFLLYILVTVPLLLFVLVHLVAGLPRILATAWDSLGQQWATLQSAIAQGAALMVASSVVQMLVLVLMTGGLLFFLFTLARKVAATVWNWSRLSWPRRIVGSIGTLAAIALLAVLFLPSTPFSGNRGGVLAGRIQFTPIREGESLTFQSMSGEVLGQETGPVITTTAAPTSSPTSSVSPTSSPTATPVSAATATPAGGVVTTPSPSPAPSASSSPGAAATASPTASPVPSPAPSATP